MKTIIQILSSGTIAYVVMLILVPVLKKIALRAGLTDKPNSRKVHHEPVPLVGGIAMVLTVSLLGPTSLLMFPVSQELWMVLNSSVVLFVIGVIDDKFDLKAKYKLVIQLFCAFMVAAAGVRLTSLYGLFGMHELPIFTQYAITVVLITGVVNAFNLMDGIDGMVGLLGFIGLGMMSIFPFLFLSTQ